MKYIVKFTNKVTGLINQVENLNESQKNKVLNRADHWTYTIEVFEQREIHDYLEQEDEPNK